MAALYLWPTACSASGPKGVSIPPNLLNVGAGLVPELLPLLVCER